MQENDSQIPPIKTKDVSATDAFFEETAQWRIKLETITLKTMNRNTRPNFRENRPERKLVVPLIPSINASTD
jgi:hypothetical protein